MSSGQSPRPVKVIVGEALDELRDREARLAAFGNELDDARRFIKLFSKAIGEAQHPRPTKVNPTGDTKRAILDAVAKSLDPMSMEQIAEAIGRDPAPWVSMQIKKQVGAGRLVEVSAGRFGVTQALGRGNSDDEAAA